MAAKVHCESSRHLGTALFYTPPHLLPSNGEKNSIYGHLRPLFMSVSTELLVTTYTLTSNDKQQALVVYIQPSNVDMNNLSEIVCVTIKF
jgi:hypothetical protein